MKAWEIAASCWVTGLVTPRIIQNFKATYRGWRRNDHCNGADSRNYHFVECICRNLYL